MGYNLAKTKKALLNKWDWDTPSNNIPLFLWGPIGIGKTSIVEQAVIERKKKDLEAIIKNFAETEKEHIEAKCKLERLENYNRSSEIQDILDENLLVLRLAERPIEQLQGVPTPNFKGRVTMFFMPENMVNISKSDWVVIFLDELDKADEWKMAAATHMIESKRVGEFTFPKDTFIICAGNRVDDSWISKEVVPELKNRGAHVDVDPDLDVWLDWASKNKIRTDIIGFHKYAKSIGKNFLVVYNEGDNNFATPRTWHYASLQADKIERRGGEGWEAEMYDEIEQLIGKTALEYKAYRELYRKVNVEDILNGTASVPKLDGVMTNNRRNSILTKQYIYAMAICERVTADLLKNDRYLNNFVNALEDFIADARVIIFISLQTNKRELIDIISSNKKGERLIDEFFESMM